MLKINEIMLKNLSEEAKKSERKRKNLNFHKEDSDTLQRLLNAIEPTTYCQPHKHENPDKREVFILLIGKLIVVEFDDFGNISDFIILSKETGNYAAEISPKTYHTIVSLEKNTVYYELKDGPYNIADDKKFAAWAPKEGTANCQNYIKEITEKRFSKI